MSHTNPLAAMLRGGAPPAPTESTAPVRVERFLILGCLEFRAEEGCRFLHVVQKIALGLAGDRDAPGRIA